MTAETAGGGGRAGKLAQRAALKFFPLMPLALFWMLGFAAGVERFAGHQPHSLYLTFWYAVGIVSLMAWFSPLFRPAGAVRRQRRWQALTAAGVCVYMIAAASVSFAVLSGLGAAAWNIGGCLALAGCIWSVVSAGFRGFGAFKGLSLSDHGSGARLPLATLGLVWAIDKYYDQPLGWVGTLFMPAAEILIAVAAIASLLWAAHAAVAMFAPEPAETAAAEYHLAA